jgi:putative SOS response-associated peptidase YedK
MCGRAYRTYTAEELHYRYLNKKRPRLPDLTDLQPSFNLAPTQLHPVVLERNGEAEIELQSWGLIPPWEPEFKTRISTINAKSETVFESRLYRGPVRKHRCIVPISGFYEWKKIGDRKQPYAISLKDEPILSLAGIWEAWHAGGPDERHSFSILTAQADPFMSEIHTRMPVILMKEQEGIWLSEGSSLEALQELLRSNHPGPLKAHPVSTLVNSPRNNAPECIEPLVSDS